MPPKLPSPPDTIYYTKVSLRNERLRQKKRWFRWHFYFKILKCYIIRTNRGSYVIGTKKMMLGGGLKFQQHLLGYSHCMSIGGQRNLIILHEKASYKEAGYLLYNICTRYDEWVFNVKYVWQNRW